ncbi:hypothetical protein PMAYCL1PPCAC_27314 [Pristionchus mayeri]|uniref:Uncharacterized protein n=1 Tax=Pristionchus mayeri TaxID=1317129 RepID=A0AAN5IA42_9BILA|nr:hypothetical protein PMAYCL1PPCAC_27314 [Pristionchus mayeri]
MNLRRGLHTISYILVIMYVGIIFVYLRLIVVLFRKNKIVPNLLRIMLLNIVCSHLMEVFSGIVYCWFDYNIFSGFPPIVIYDMEEECDMYMLVNFLLSILIIRPIFFRLNCVAAFWPTHHGWRTLSLTSPIQSFASRRYSGLFNIKMYSNTVSVNYIFKLLRILLQLESH